MASAGAIRLLVQLRQLQQIIAILRIQLARLAEVGGRIVELALLHQRLGHAELRAGRFGVQFDRLAVVLTGAGIVAGLSRASAK